MDTVSVVWAKGKLNSIPPAIHAPARADESVLDDVVAIEHLAMMELVVDGVDVSSESGEDRDLEVLVFEIDSAPAPGSRRSWRSSSMG